MPTPPTVQQFNSSFMANNPQYSYTKPGTAPTTPMAPYPGLSSYVPQPKNNLSQTTDVINAVGGTPNMGAPAKAPVTQAPDNTIPASQTKPASTNTGLLGSPSSLNSGNPYPGYVSQLGQYGDLSNDPTYQRLQSEYNNIAQSAPVAQRNIMNDTTRGIPNTVEQSRLGATASTYSDQLSAKQAEISNYLSARGQSIGALGSAVSATAPQSQLGFLTSPISGQPVYGNGTIGGLAGLSYQAGQIQNAGTLAGQGQGQAIAINNARDTTTQLSNLLKTSNLNQNQLAISNWVGNVVAQNLSNPTLAPIQNAITSAINQYAQAIGVSPTDLTSSLISQSGSQSILAVLGNLDTQAYNNYTNTGTVATGGGVSAPTTNLGTTPNATSGVTTGGNKYVVTP